jgi:hypothetical protein
VSPSPLRLANIAGPLLRLGLNLFETLLRCSVITSMISCLRVYVHARPPSTRGMQASAQSASLVRRTFEVRKHMRLHKLHASQNLSILKTG